MTEVAILIPVLARPHRVQPLVESLAASQRNAVLIPVFICSPFDWAEQAAVVEAGLEPLVVEWEPGKADYAKKLNEAFRHATEEFVFFAADDLAFQPGWADICVDMSRASGACVIGTNDLGNSRVVIGQHSTHTLVHRDYAECGVIDDPSKLVYEGYWHEYVDDEFVRTARWRGTFAFARDAIVEHLHPDWRKAEWDSTYEKGREHRLDDLTHFRERQFMWRGNA